jgi:hypothetical protein
MNYAQVKKTYAIKKAEKKFKPHMMYDPKTGKGVKANKLSDHLRMKKMGYGHTKKKNYSVASDNSLKRWGNEDWGYINKGDKKKPKAERGRYLPKSVRQSLTPSQKVAENRKKRRATQSGKPEAKYSESVRKKVRSTYA